MTVRRPAPGRSTAYVWAFILFWLLFASSAPLRAAQDFGPADSAAKAGNWAIAVGGSYYEDRLETKGHTVFANTKTIQNRIYHEYIEASYGFVQNWEVYARAGAADVRVKRAFEFEDFQDAKRPFGAMGIRGSFFRKGPFTLGAFLDATLYSDYDSRLSGMGVINGTSASFSSDVHYETPWDATIGLGLKYDFGRFLLYGGPFAYVFRVRIEGQIDSTVFNGYVSLPYQEEVNLGGYLGIRLILPEGFSAGVEGQFRTRYSFGVTLNKSF